MFLKNPSILILDEATSALDNESEILVGQSLEKLAHGRTLSLIHIYDAFPRRCDTFRWVIDNTHDSLCFNCGRRETCWKQEYTATLEGMNALSLIHI